MLKRIEVENFKNFKDKYVFDLSCTKDYQFNIDCVKDGLVNKGIIYGINGIGKSNLGLAIFDLIGQLTDKYSNQDLYTNYKHAKLTGSDTEFKYFFQIDNQEVIYNYVKDANQNVVLEILTINNKEIISYQYGIPFSTEIVGAEKLNRDLSQNPNLSALKYIKENVIINLGSTNGKIFIKFMSFVDRMLYFRSLSDRKFIGLMINPITNIFNDISENKNLLDLEGFLNEAHIKCKLIEYEKEGMKSIGFDFGDGAIRSIGDIASTGTSTLMLFYFWYQSLIKSDRVSFVFIDEFDAFYHFKLSELIVKKLKMIEAQVILTTHNTSLLNNDLIRPDCAFIMGETKISPASSMTEKELRDGHNIEKMYKSGAFN